ncbi:unnamed protein product [Didymodactylos carnosus]|uniref:PARP catalytic domain-containing protein n=1 Tax=Didymodactylos carnosus TaxID=1234261 RepID=A0A8S2FRZ5_9BILA|nr:unnamed protein product [Didymodactylos carnosus]CAF4334568.1 unnamed protein product [Didymodactylos carnosus]
MTFLTLAIVKIQSTTSFYTMSQTKQNKILLKNDSQRHRVLVLFHLIDGLTFLIRFIILCMDLSAITNNTKNHLNDSLRYLLPILVLELLSSFILFLVDSLYLILKYLGGIFYETDSDDICNERKYLWPLATLICFKKVDCYYDYPKLILLTRIYILIGCWLLRFISFCLACACDNQYFPRGVAYAVITSLSLVLSVFTIFFEYLHYKRLWNYHLQDDYEIKYNKAHLCFLPYSVISDQRTTEWHSPQCRRGSNCQSKSLFHILVYHSSRDTAYLISTDVKGFKPGSKGMLGEGIYFATSINHTETKAHYFGAYICVKVNLGRIYRTNVRRPVLTPELKKHYDTVYFKHSQGLDEFCVLNPKQVLSWIITVNQDLDVTSKFEPCVDNIAAQWATKRTLGQKVDFIYLEIQIVQNVALEILYRMVYKRLL